MNKSHSWREVKIGLLGEFKNGLNFGKECQENGITKLINVKDIFAV